jgi:hypothetical protein
MSAFHTGSYGERFQSMGDESHFERLNTNFIRFGFNRPDVAKFYQISLNIRAAPDYIQSDPARLVEVMGMGAKPLKLKLEKLAALNWWNSSGMDVWLWVWSSTRQAHAQIKYNDLMTLINKNDVSLGNFHEGKKYLSISSKLLDWVDG